MKKWFVFALMGLVTACGAESGASDSQSDKDAMESAGAKGAKAVFESVFAGAEVTETRPTNMEGVLELTVNGDDTVYMSEDGRFLFVGKMMELRDGEVFDPLEERMAKIRAEGIKELNEDDMITYEAEDEKYEVYAFTDVSCGYCRKLHRHLEEFSDAGITIHYLAFPRGGSAAPAAEAMRHIWCAEDPLQALTDAKLEEKYSNAELGECADLVDEQYELGTTFGVRGTPAIYSRDGKQLGGYVTPEQMLSKLKD